MDNQYLIKYLSKNKIAVNYTAYMITEREREEKQKRDIWNLFFYESAFTPFEWNRYIIGNISYDEMMNRYQMREADDYYDYIEDLYGDGFFNGGYYGDLDAYAYWYDDWDRVYWRYQEGHFTRDEYLKFTKGYTLWIVNNNIGWTLDDEGGYINDPPASWQPLDNPPDLTIPSLGYVGQALDLHEYEGKYYYILPSDPPDPPFRPVPV